MGTKVHPKSCLSGHYPMNGLNEDTGGTWPLYYEDRALNGKFCNGFASRPVNGYSEYDRELLTQTMIRHEDTFRKQVLELHRLYRIQRTLMVELKGKGEQHFPVQVQSSQPSAFSTQILPQDKEKRWQAHAFPLTNTSCSMETVSDGDDSQTHLRFLNGTSFQSGLLSRENGVSQEVNQFSDSKPQKFPRRMIDLQLPADAYMENDEAKHPEEKDIFRPLFGSVDLSNRNCVLQNENDVLLSLGNSWSSRGEKSVSHLGSGLTPQQLADLNESLKEFSRKEVAASSSRFPLQETNIEALEEHQNSVKSASSLPGPREDLFHDRCRGGVGTVFLCEHRYEKGMKQPFYNSEWGQSSNHVSSFTSGLSVKDVQPSSESVMPKKSPEFSMICSPKQNKTESWLKEKPSQINEFCDVSPYILNGIYSGLTVPTMSGPLSTLSFTDHTKTASSLVSSWRKASNGISRIPIEVQALSCWGSTPVNTQSISSSTSSRNFGKAWEQWQCNHDFRSLSRSAHEVCSCPNSLQHGFLSENDGSSHVSLPWVSIDKPNLNNGANPFYKKYEGHGPQECLKGLHYTVKSVNDMNLTLAPPIGIWNGFFAQHMFSDVDGKKENPSGETSWLGTRSPCSEPTINIKNDVQKDFGIQGFTQIMSSNCTSTAEVDKKKEEGGPLDILQDSPLLSKTKGSSVPSSCKRILGFPLPQCSKTSFTSIAYQEISPFDDVKQRVKEEFVQGDSSPHRKLLDSDKQIHADLVPERRAVRSVSGFRDDINLNASATTVDQPDSPARSCKDAIEVLSPAPVHGTATRFVPEIDLEAPITSLSEEEILSAGPASHCNPLFSTVEPYHKKDSLQAIGFEDEALVRIAAETIHLISLDKPIHSEDIALHPSSPASADILCWFADVVTSSANGLEKVLSKLRGDGDGDQESSDIDGMDYFEYMTLKLKETKIDEYCCRHLERENRKEEETTVTSLLLTRSRRGQARRRHQRRDFQKDILPGLASLSRYEVTEDLQMIGGLMRASGQVWQPGGVRRNTQSRSHCEARGTRWPKGNAAAVVKISVDSQPKQPSNADVEIDMGSILGWGKTTRRCRRQRCSSDHTES